MKKAEKTCEIQPVDTVSRTKLVGEGRWNGEKRAQAPPARLPRVPIGRERRDHEAC